MMTRIIGFVLIGASCATVLGGGATAYVFSDRRFNGNDHIYAVNLYTGLTTDLGDAGAERIEALCVTPDGTLYGLGAGDNFISYLWNFTTLPGTAIGRDTFSGRIREHPGIAYDPATNRIWNIQGAAAFPDFPNGVSPLYRINPVNAKVDRTFFTAATRNRFMDAIAINGSGQAFGADFANKRELYQVNLTNGRHTLVGSMDISETRQLSDMSFDSCGRLWAIAGPGNIYRINTQTGHATRISTIDLPNQMWTTLAVFESFCACDTNCDGSVNQFDIQGFVLALSDREAYSTQFPGCTAINADANDDGSVNQFDIQSFLACME